LKKNFIIHFDHTGLKD